MNASKKRLTLSITLTEWEEELFEQARKIVFPYYYAEDPHFLRSNYRRLMRLSVLAFLRGVIKQSAENPQMRDTWGWQYPKIAILTPETKKDMDDRNNGIVDSSPGYSWPAPNRWN